MLSHRLSKLFHQFTRLSFLLCRAYACASTGCLPSVAATKIQNPRTRAEQVLFSVCEVRPPLFPHLTLVNLVVSMSSCSTMLVTIQHSLSQLRRYRRGNKEPFVAHLSGLGESSVSLGAVFPATYYQPVRVCSNCYRVYSMIDEARTKSVKRLDAQAAAAAAPGWGMKPGSGADDNVGQPQPRAVKRARGGAELRRGGERRPSRLHSSAAVELEEDDRSRGGRRHNGTLPASGGDDPSSYPGPGDSRGEWDRGPDQRDGEDSESISGESLALMRAQAAIDGLTRGDICELRSFAKPPAAVNMVAAALMIALTGQGEPTAAGWMSAKRYMTNIDRLFAAVAGLDLSSMRVSQTRKLEAYVRNPAFRPEVIACVSLPASKICAWVLGVLVSARF